MRDCFLTQSYRTGYIHTNSESVTAQLPDGTRKECKTVLGAKRFITSETTEIEYQVHGNYGYGHGYEEVTAEATRKEARARLKEYRENEPGVPFKIIKRRVSK